MLGGENEKLKSKQVVAHSEEEKKVGASSEKVTETATEKPQAVMVSTGQNSEAAKPVGPQESTEVLSETWEKSSDKP